MHDGSRTNLSSAHGDETYQVQSIELCEFCAWGSVLNRVLWIVFEAQPVRLFARLLLCVNVQIMEHGGSSVTFGIVRTKYPRLLRSGCLGLGSIVTSRLCYYCFADCQIRYR